MLAWQKRPMRRLAFLLLVFFVGASPAAFAVPGNIQFERSEADKAALDRISAYLNAMHTLKGSFVQLGPDGQVDEGVFYIEKPGRMRFEYRGPNPILIVSDGSTVAVANRRLNTVDHYPLWTTPLSLILSDDLNLKRNASIAGVSREPGEIIVNARASSAKVNGNLALVFSDPDLQLKQWTIVDGQGLTTTVTLRDLEPGATLDPALFTLPAAEKPQP